MWWFKPFAGEPMAAATVAGAPKMFTTTLLLDVMAVLDEQLTKAV
jgi:hypothetical protein